MAVVVEGLVVWTTLKVMGVQCLVDRVLNRHPIAIVVTATTTIKMHWQHIVSSAGYRQPLWRPYGRGARIWATLSGEHVWPQCLYFKVITNFGVNLDWWNFLTPMTLCFNTTTGNNVQTVTQCPRTRAFVWYAEQWSVWETLAANRRMGHVKQLITPSRVELVQSSTSLSTPPPSSSFEGDGHVYGEASTWTRSAKKTASWSKDTLVILNSVTTIDSSTLQTLHYNISYFLQARKTVVSKQRKIRFTSTTMANSSVRPHHS